MKFILASQNKHKLAEFRQILTPLGIMLVSPDELGLQVDVEENGTTFAENSRIKAQALLELTGLPTIADDSGLQVDALKGAPGIFSARYGGAACKDDAQRCLLLLHNLQDVEEAARTARFVCVITCLFPDGRSIVSQGVCEGRIAARMSGSGGFGYDPVFYVPSEQCTFSEMPQQRKNALSHRGKALAEFYQKLSEEISNADK